MNPHYLGKYKENQRIHIEQMNRLLPLVDSQVCAERVVRIHVDQQADGAE